MLLEIWPHTPLSTWARLITKDPKACFFTTSNLWLQNSKTTVSRFIHRSHYKVSTAVPHLKIWCNHLRPEIKVQLWLESPFWLCASSQNSRWRRPHCTCTVQAQPLCSCHCIFTSKIGPHKTNTVHCISTLTPLKIKRTHSMSRELFKSTVLELTMENISLSYCKYCKGHLRIQTSQ